MKSPRKFPAWPERKRPEGIPKLQRGTRIATYLPTLLIVVTFFLVAIAPGRPNAALLRSSGALAAASYTRAVNDILVSRSWLVRVDDQATGMPTVALTQSAREHPEVLEFVRNSYLRDDLAANDPDLWHFEGNRLLGINPGTHNFFDPFFGRARWTGDIGFRRENGEATHSHPILFERRAGSAGETPIELLPSGSAAAVDGVIRLESPQPLGDVSRGFTLRANDADLARLVMIGDRPVIVLLCSAGRDYDITVTTGAYLPATCSTQSGTGVSAQTVAYPLSDGDALEIRLRGGVAVLVSFRVARHGSGLSTYRPFGARSFDLVAESLGRDFAQAMDWAVNADIDGAESEFARSTVALTLSRPIESQAEAILTDEMTTLRQALGRGPNDYFPAAVTVMDATNGELLALASYPRRQDLSGNWAARTSSLARNQNFVALAIGSAAKIPISAAILTRFPGLVNLCINGSIADATGKLRIHDILGASVDPFISDTVAGDRVDFSRFLRSSSNRYGATLMLLSAARQQAGARPGIYSPQPGRRVMDNDAYSLDPAGHCANPTRLAPSFIFAPLRAASAEADEYGNVLALPLRLHDAQGGESWIDALQGLFSMGDISGVGETPYNPSIWMPLLGMDEDNYTFFAGISPDRERFLDPSQSTRDYMMIMLGGSNARWTAVKLAEAYGRIVTGRNVTAHLIQDPAADGMARESFALPPNVRRALLGGMAQAAGMEPASGIAPSQGHATAAAIGILARQLPVPEGEIIRVFAKTGTPGLQARTRTPLNELMNRLIGARAITLGPGGLEVSQARASEPIEQAIRRLAADRHVPITFELAGRVAAAMRHMNARFLRGLNVGLEFEGPNRLRGLRPDADARRGADDSSEAGILALVVGRYCRSDIEANAPLRAMSIVVNAQARTGDVRGTNIHTGPNPAIAVVSRLLRDREGPLVHWLGSPIEGRRCRH